VRDAHCCTEQIGLRAFASAGAAEE
jgi:hypothetical protein